MSNKKGSTLVVQEQGHIEIEESYIDVIDLLREKKKGATSFIEVTREKGFMDKAGHKILINVEKIITIQ